MKRIKVIEVQEYALTSGSWKLNGTSFTYRDTTLKYSGETIINTATATFSNNGSFTDATWRI